MAINSFIRIMKNFIRKVQLKYTLLSNPKSKEIERNILREICAGRGLDIGCGSNKIGNSIGVDITPTGEKGKFGNQKGEISKADIISSGDELPFENESFDYIVSNHCLEHFEDAIKTLKEWKRVLKKGGKIGIIVPDEDYVNTINLDPTHKLKFNLSKLHKTMEEAGFSILREGKAMPKWSIYAIAEK